MVIVPAAVRAGSEADEAAAARHAYTEKIAAKYNFRYGRENPFLPSNATTDNGEFIDPKWFPTAEYCGHCHQESHKQWRESAHSNANRVPYYLKNVALLNDSKGVEFSRHCEGCHDPISVVAGALTQGSPKKRPYDQDGVTCSVCHAIQKVDTRGTGSYVMGVPAVLVDENGQPITRKVSDGEILAHLDRHSKAVMRDFYKTSEFCSSCHKAALPRALNDYKWQRAISLYDEWQNSSFAKQSPLPFYVKDSVSTCQTCHMQRENLKLTDSGAKKGQLASHRWLGAHTVIPKIYGFDEQAARIVQFLQNSVFNVDIFALEHGEMVDSASNKGLVAPLGLTPFTITPGEILTADVVIHTVPRQARAESIFDRIRAVAARNNVAVHDLSVQSLHGKLHVELHVELNENLPLIEAHSFVSSLEAEILRETPEIDSVLTHIESEPATIEQPEEMVEEDRRIEKALRDAAAQYGEIVDVHQILVGRTSEHITLSCTARFQITCRCIVSTK